MQPDGSKPLTPWIGYLMLAGVVFGWSSGVVWVRGVHEVIPPLGMSFWRWFIGALMVLPFARASLKKDGALIRKHLVFYFMMGGLIVGGSTLSTVSLNFTTATNVGIVNATQPMMTVLVAWAFFKDKLNAWQWAGIFVAFAGILAMVSKADLAVFLDLSFNVGDFIMIGAVVMFAYYANNLPRLPSSVSFVSSLFVVMFAGSLLLIPLYALESIVLKPVPVSTQAVVTFFFLALVPTVIPTIMWNRAVPAVGVSRSAIFVNLMPVFTAALAIGFLGESLFLYHVTGSLLVFAGIVLVVWRR